MALVTFGTPAAQRFVIGNLMMKVFVVNGATGSTLNTGMSGIVWMDVQRFCQAGTASLVTGFSVSSGVITLTTAGSAMVNEVVMVMGREG